MSLDKLSSKSIQTETAQYHLLNLKNSSKAKKLILITMKLII